MLFPVFLIGLMANLLFSEGYPGRVQVINFYNEAIRIRSTNAVCLLNSFSDLIVGKDQLAEWEMKTNGGLGTTCFYPGYGGQELLLETLSGKGIAEITLGVRCRNLVDCNNGEAWKQLTCKDPNNVFVDVTPSEVFYPFDRQPARFTITISPTFSLDALKGCTDKSQAIEHWPRWENETCNAHTDCSGYGLGRTDKACCSGTCKQKKIDYFGIGWCPEKCKKFPWSSPGSC